MQCTAQRTWSVMAMAPAAFLLGRGIARQASGTPKTQPFEFTVVGDNAKMRLDRFLRSQLKLVENPVPHQVICKWIRQGRVSVAADDKNVVPLKKKEIQPTTRVHTGQRWRVNPDKRTDEAALPLDKATDSSLTKPTRPAAVLPLDQWIVYEDEDIVVLNKPAGIAVQGGTMVDQSIDGSLEVLQRPDYPRPRLIHRLDQETSGLLIVGKNRTVTERLGKLFQQARDGDQAIKKAYIAIVQSEKPLDSWFQGTKQIRLEGHMAKLSTGRHQSIVMVNVAGQVQWPWKTSRPSGRVERMWHCSTDVEWIQSSPRVIKLSSGERPYWQSVLRLWPHSGRKHQLRVQCAYQLQAPMVGDCKYSHWPQDSDVRLCLHLERLELKDWKGPEQHLVVEAPVPKEMRECLEK